MLLRSLKLHNFRQYQGEQKITFSTDKEKNVTVILGKNTGGKTTIVQAFNWALYDIISFQDKMLLNINVQNEMLQNTHEIVLVEIELTHDNIDYTVTRSLDYFCDISGNIKPDRNSILKITYKEKDGQTEIIKATERRNIINKILPDKLSDYFFFDGERIENISNRQDVSDSVKGLMGLSVLDAAINHLRPDRKNTVYGKFKASLDLGGDERAIKLQKNIEDLMERRNKVEESIQTVIEEIDYFNLKKEELAEKLRENKNTAELQKLKEKLEQNVKIKTKELLNLQKGLVMDFNNEHYAYFSQVLAKKAIQILSIIDENTVGIPEMNVKSIEYLIERGVCICGSELKENSEELKNVLKEMELLPPNSIGTIVRQFINNAETYNSVNDRYYKNIVSRYKEIRRCQDDISNMEDELKNVSLSILGTDDMRIEEKKFNDTKYKIKELEKKKESLYLSKGGYERDIERYKKEYDSLAAVSEKNKKVLEYIEYTNRIYNWFSSTYKEKELEIRKKLTERVTNIFCKMYHGKRKVRIDDKYRVELLTTLGDKELKSDESRGLETVKNFAFIAGLVDLAREKITGGDEMEQILSSEPYPLVMDAPFSNADEIHVSNISKILPEIAEQVIMVVMDKDWSFAEATMEERVGKKYRLDKQNEMLTYIKEVEI